MSIYNALYGRDGHGVGPNEPEKKGFARFCQMVGRDLGQLLGTNLMVCVLCLPAALGVSLSVAAPGKTDPCRPLESRLRLWLHWHAGAGAAVLCIGLCV